MEHITDVLKGGKTPRRPRKPVGRVGPDKQEAVIKKDVVMEKVDHLVKLHVTAAEASRDLADGIKKIAEQSGLKASVVRLYITAKAGEKFEDTKRDVTQLAILFEVEP